MFPADLGQRFADFADAREDFLLNFGYNTARAYWADLDDWLGWCVECGHDPLDLRAARIDRYLDALVGQGYSPSTCRRRRTALNGLASRLR
jgi:site-specific recombinase XerD